MSFSFASGVCRCTSQSGFRTEQLCIVVKNIQAAQCKCVSLLQPKASGNKRITSYQYPGLILNLFRLSTSIQSVKEAKPLVAYACHSAIFPLMSEKKVANAVENSLNQGDRDKPALLLL